MTKLHQHDSDPQKGLQPRGSPNLEWEANAIEGLLLRPSQSSDCPADEGKKVDPYPGKSQCVPSCSLKCEGSLHSLLCGLMRSEKEEENEYLQYHSRKLISEFHSVPPAEKTCPRKPALASNHQPKRTDPRSM